MDKDTIRIALKEAVYQRRSTRLYTTQPVPEELLEEVIDAGRHAASAMNAQTTHLIVITNPEKLAQLREVMTGVLAGLTEKEGMSANFVKLIRRAKEGQLVDVAYGSPALIVTANKKGSQNAVADCSCVLANMMLTASACGLGNCWINQFHMTNEMPQVQDFFAGLGVAGDESVFGALALGYAEKLETTPLPRKGNPVTYIK